MVNVLAVIFAIKYVSSLYVTLYLPLDELKLLEAINYKYRFSLTCIGFREVCILKKNNLSFKAKYVKLEQLHFLWAKIAHGI